MPMIDFYVEEGALSAAALAKLPAIVSKIALRYEGFEGSKFAAEFTWIYTHLLPKAHVVQAAGKPAKPLYRFDIYTMHGLLDQPSKIKLASDIAQAVYELEGTRWDANEATNRVWTLYRDMREGDWLDGEVVSNLPMLRAMAKAR
ncbi:MAG: hypothetical protein K2V38_28650 [Gemmataceae bacterium]|nr:hypothetical protein [Gemmataceae bacterium]